MGSLEKEEAKLVNMLREAQSGMSWGLRERFLERLQGLVDDTSKTIRNERQDDFIPRPGNEKDLQRWREERELDALQTQAERVNLKRQWERESRANRHSDEALKAIASKYQKLGLQVNWRDALRFDQEGD